MSALYRMQYAGSTGNGAGAIFIGNGQILGIDIGDIRYRGKYYEEDGKMRLKGQMTAHALGARLVTGDPLAPGQSLPIDAEWPVDAKPDEIRHVTVGGRHVAVTFEKIGDIIL